MATSTASSELKNDPFTPRQGRDLRWRNVSMTLECDPRHYYSSHGHEEDHEQTNHEVEGKDPALVVDDNVEGQQQQPQPSRVPDDGTRQKNKTTVTKHILNNVWGEVPAGQTTAILGPSGSGKTSLLNILSGRVATTTTTTTSNGDNNHKNTKSKSSTKTKQNQRLTVTAQVRLNNFAVDPSNITVRRSAIAFVAQDDSLQATATVREAILFSAKLRLDCQKYQDEDLEHLTTRMITELGLTQCQHTIIGSALMKGISGGERKRTSVGVELVTQPSLVFLDEPTSGLDSYSAMQLCKVLKKVATAGSSVLFTIHQPSSKIFKTFDHILLLKSGRLLFSGNVASLAPYFEQRGYAVPDQYNPADWIMHVAQAYSTAELQAAGFFPQQSESDWGPAAQAGDSEEKKRDLLGNTIHEDKKETIVRLGWPGQTKLLFAREVTNFGRNKHALKARTAMTVAISTFIGIIFFEVAQTSYANFINVQSTFGALLMSLLANVFSTTLPSLLVFPQERPVFLREYSTDHYSVFSYFMSRLTMEFLVTAVQVTISGTITYFCVGFEGQFGIFYLDLYLLAMTSTALGVLLGSSVEDPSSAVELLPGAILPQILFAGFFVPPELIPGWLAWLRYICPLTYAVRIALANEFDGRCDDVVEEDPSIPNYCETVLDNVGVDVDETWWNWLVLVGMFVGMRVMALINLRRKASKFY